MHRLLLLACAVLYASPANAAPIVSYTVNGTPGDWMLEFSITNTLGIPDQQIYFFGVELPARDILNSPTEWDPDLWTSYDNSSNGGSIRIYNNVWTFFGNVPELTEPEISMGETQAGFVARVSSLVAPTSVNWFAYSLGDTPYMGSDAFNIPTNPGFEGVASNTTTAVPEPVTFVLIGSGTVLAAASRRLRRRRSRIGPTSVSARSTK